MIDIDVLIAVNIRALMKKQDVSQSELAEKLGITEAGVRKILNGAASLSSRQLRQAAEYYDVSVDELVSEQENIEYTDAVHSMMNKVHTDAAREALEIADELADMIIFHARVVENAREMMQVAEYV